MGAGCFLLKRIGGAEGLYQRFYAVLGVVLRGTFEDMTLVFILGGTRREDVVSRLEWFAH